MSKLREDIWDEESLVYFRNTFSSLEGKHTLANMLYELNFLHDEVGTDAEGNVTLESAIEGTTRRNYAATLLRRLAFNDEDNMDVMITGLLKSVTRIKKEKTNE